MAIAVIAIHTHPLENLENQELLKIYRIIVNIAVPFFFITSSYLLFTKFYKSNEEKSILKNYIKKTIKLYIIWSIVYLPISIYSCIINQEKIVKYIILYIRNFLLIGEHYYSWPLWYLLSLIYALVIIYFCKFNKRVRKFNLKEWKIAILFLFVFIIGNLISYITTNIDNTSGVWYNIIRTIQITISNGRLLTGFFYVAIGMCIAKYGIYLDSKIALIGMITSMILSYFFGGIIIFNLFLYFFTFELVITMNLRDNNIYSYLRKASTVMYFTHMIFFFIWTLCVGTERCYGYRGFLFTLIGTIILSVIVILVNERLKFRKNNIKL